MLVHSHTLHESTVLRSWVVLIISGVLVISVDVLDPVLLKAPFPLVASGVQYLQMMAIGEGLVEQSDTDE